MANPPYEEWSLTDQDTFETICARLLWGTYGLKPTKERLLQGHLWKPLAECDPLGVIRPLRGFNAHCLSIDDRSFT